MEFFQPPFRRLSPPRHVERADLPAPLCHFYAFHEGLGTQGDEAQGFTIVPLHEVRPASYPADCAVSWPWWKGFTGLQIGFSSFADQIIYATSADPYPLGTIVAAGVDIAGPESHPYIPQGSLVLARSFADWLEHLESCGWNEFGLCPGGIRDLEEPLRSSLYRYYQSLNPDISWT